MPSSAKGLVTFETWNRKVHYYLGLFFLFFLWLFSLTGLLLNHGQWSMAQAANQRKETRYEIPVRPSNGDTDLARAREMMRQLGIVTEDRELHTEHGAGPHATDVHGHPGTRTVRLGEVEAGLRALGSLMDDERRRRGGRQRQTLRLASPRGERALDIGDRRIAAQSHADRLGVAVEHRHAVAGG